MRHERSKRGFTLIELLIVMLIISIVVAGAVVQFRARDRMSQSSETVAKQLQSLMQLGLHQAVLEDKEYAFVLTPKQYQFMRYETNPSGQTSWQIIQRDKLFKSKMLPSQLYIGMTGQSQTLSSPYGLMIHLSSSGQMTPFVMKIGKPNQPPEYEVMGTEDGHIEVRQI